MASSSAFLAWTTARRPDLTFRIRRAGAGQVGRAATVANTQFTPLEIAQLYNFPANLDGTGECIGIIELGGGFKTADLKTYFSSLGLPAPTVSSVSVDGGANTPNGNADSADGEVVLDIEVAAAIAPKAKIVVYFTGNTSQGFLDAITQAVHDTVNKPSVISISWGGPESNWTDQAFQQFDQAFQDAATLGVTITVAAGDNGSSDGVNDGSPHADFPASSPNVLACGGTSLKASSTTIISEVVWNDGTDGGATGGGVSDHFLLPAYQNDAGVPPAADSTKNVGRGLPDVAADADPNTGYSVRVDGQNTEVGGTSAVAPLWAGLVARLNQGARQAGRIPEPDSLRPHSAERRLQRYHQRQQRCLLRRTGLGRLQRTGRGRRHQVAPGPLLVVFFHSGTDRAIKECNG